MPKGNKKGPTAEGPMTGRKLGYCVGNEVAGFQNADDDIAYGFRNRGNRRRIGRAFGNTGRGRGFGRGLQQNRQINQTKGSPSHQSEIDSLKERLRSLENQLKKDSD